MQPRTALAWQAAPNTVLRTGFGLIWRHSAGERRGIWWGSIRLTQRHFSAGCWARPADRISTVRLQATVAANQTFYTSGFAQGQFSCASALSNPATCLHLGGDHGGLRTGKLHAPYFMQWSFCAGTKQIGTTMNLRAQYVGTRAVNQPYETQVNRYQTVCQGCFRSVSLRPAIGPEIRRGDAA